MPAQRPEDCDHLIVSDYTITSRGPDRKRTSSSARGAEVMRRQADGTWRFVIDNPTGTAWPRAERGDASDASNGVAREASRRR